MGKTILACGEKEEREKNCLGQKNRFLLTSKTATGLLFGQKGPLSLSSLQFCPGSRIFISQSPFPRENQPCTKRLGVKNVSGFSKVEFS